MLILVTYDVNTTSAPGRRRLRRVARACLDFGQRVQYSVFECLVGDSDFVRLRARLLQEIDPTEDSLRIYPLSQLTLDRIEHYGVREPRSFDDPFIV